MGVGLIRRFRQVVVFTTVLVAVALFAGTGDIRAQAGAITVADGDVAGLIAAINSLNTNGGGTIELAENGTYTVTAPSDWWYGPDAFPAITGAIVIEGNGATIQRPPTAPKFRFFYVSGGFSTIAAGDLTIRDLTLEGGLARGGNGGGGLAGGGGGAGLGGAIYNQGSVKLVHVTLAQNTAQGGSGGCCGGGAAGGGGIGGDGATTTPYEIENAGGGGGFRYNGQRQSFYYDSSLGGDGHGTTAGGGFTGSEGGLWTGGTSPYGGNGGSSGENTGAGGGGGGGYKPGQNGVSPTFSSCFYVTGWNCPGGDGAIGGGKGGFGLGALNLVGLGGGAFGGGGGGSTEEYAGAGGGGVGGGGGGGWLSAGSGGFAGGGGGGYEGGNGGFAGGGGGVYGHGGGAGGWGAGWASGGSAGGGGALGGAIFNHTGTLSVISSTLASNTAQGGTGGNVGSGYGGAIFNLNGTVTLASLTASGNSAVNGTGAPTTGTVVYSLSHNGGRTDTSSIPDASVTLINTSLSSPELVSNQVDGTATVQTATAPEVTLSANSLTFARQALNTTSAAQRLTITNTGSAALIVSSVATSGDFGETTTCATVAVGGTCHIDVTFTPTAAQLRAGSLTIESNALDTPETIGLTGRGGFPGVSLNPSSLSFGSQLISTTSASQRIVLTNSGEDTLTVSSVLASGEYTLTSTCAVVAPGGTCNIDVTFAPTTAGDQPGSVVISDDASGSPHTARLSGFGTAPVVSLSASSLSLSAPLLQQDNESVTVNNIGDGLLIVGSIAVSAPFTQTNTCATVQPGGSCSITVHYTPTAPATVNGTLTINDNAQLPHQTVTLTGTGTAPDASISATSLDFGDQAAEFTSAPQTITITNHGPGPLAFQPIAIAGDYQQTNNCSQLSAGGICTVSVTFKPTAAGPRPGSLSIPTNATEGTFSVTLGGTGVQPAVTQTASSLSFGSMRVGGTTPSQIVTIHNDGPVQLLVTSVSFNTTDYVQQNTCSTPVDAGHDCAIAVSFAPTGAGDRPGVLTVAANAASAIVVNLSGTGTTPVTPTAHISSSPNPSPYGQPVAFTVQLSTTPDAVPTGDVTLSENGQSIASATLDGTGLATVTVPSLAPGAHLIFVSYPGDAVFTPLNTYATYPVTTALAGYPAGMVTGDFDGDGKLDVAVLVHGAGYYGWELDLLSNGTLTRHNLYSYSGYGFAHLVTGDFNGDGISDLAYADSNYPWVYVQLGSKNGLGYVQVLEVPGTYYYNPIYSVTAGDLNRDGKTDLVIETYGGNYYAQGSSYFSYATPLSLPFSYAPGVIADLDSDGHGDYVSVQSQGGQITFNALGSSTSSSIPAGFSPASVIAADVDGDGLPDLVFAGNGHLSYARNLGAGSFAAPVVTTISGYASFIQTGDLNGDGHLDVIVGFSSGAVASYLGDGTGQFSLAGTYSTGAGIAWMQAGSPLPGTPPSVFAALNTNEILRLRPNQAGVLDAASDVGNGYTHTVNPAAVTPSVTVSDKTYDGTTAAAIATRALSGIVGTDDVSLAGGTAVFQDANVGAGKTVTISGLTLTGADASKYQLSSTTLTTSASIDPLTITPILVISDKVYDGTTSATIASISVNGVIGSDQVTATGGTAAFDDASVGTSKPVTVSGLVLGGAAAGDYELGSAMATASITPAPVVPNITVANKVYDNTTSATIATRALAGIIGNDAVALAGGSAMFGDPSVGTAKPVAVSGLTLDGPSAGNYQLSTTSLTSAADISTAPLLVTTNDASRMYGDANPPLTGTVAGVQAGDAIAGTWSTIAGPLSPAGTYPIVPALVDPGSRLGNYSVTLNGGTLTVNNPAPALTGITPDFGASGAASATITLTGGGFVPQSVVQWNGMRIGSSFVSPTTLTATIPATDLTTATVGYVSVFNATPGGGTTSAQAFLVSDSGTSVSGVDTASSSGGTATASTGGTGPDTPGSVTATFTGSGTVSVAQYTSNPSQQSGAFKSANSYFDVFVAPGSALTSLTVVNCNLKGGNYVMWFDGSAWVRVSNQTFDKSTGCTTLYFDSQTVPTLAQLMGTYFGTAIDVDAPVSTAAATLDSGAVYTFGSWTNQSVHVTLSSADASDGVGLASFTYGASGATSIGPVTSPQGAASFAVPNDGTTTIAFHGEDFAGNVEATQKRVVNIDRVAPTVTIAATPNQLWPVNDKPVAVTVSGIASDDRSGIASVSYAVTDEYGQAQPSGTVQAQPSGAYSFTLNLPASRLGTDKDGRVFTITVRVADVAGNVQTASTQVVVPHDQGK